jgi:hypothetical protein
MSGGSQQVVHVPRPFLTSSSFTSAVPSADRLLPQIDSTRKMVARRSEMTRAKRQCGGALLSSSPSLPFLPPSLSFRSGCAASRARRRYRPARGRSLRQALTWHPNLPSPTRCTTPPSHPVFMSCSAIIPSFPSASRSPRTNTRFAGFADLLYVAPLSVGQCTSDDVRRSVQIRRTPLVTLRGSRPAFPAVSASRARVRAVVSRG